MNIRFCDDTAVIEGLTDFSLKQIYESGQTFSWQPYKNGYMIISDTNIINAVQENDSIQLYPCPKYKFDYLFCYFDLGRNYHRIKEILSTDDVLREAIKFGTGMRILNQNPWDTLISFIISQNNGIPKIKKTIDKICRNYGNNIIFNDADYYSFPDASVLSVLSESELQKCGAGYRTPYIINTSKMIDKGFKLDDLKNYSYDCAKCIIQTLPGIGPKVADCILLYSLGFTEAFPVDVWIKRIIETLYIKNSITPEEAGIFAKKAFGDYAGIAQQYLFYYARMKKIGK